MTNRRPMEDKRAQKGLGARSPQGETTRADPRGRMTDSASFAEAEGEGSELPVIFGKTREPRARQAKRRTVRDNPEGKRSKKR